VGIGDWGLGIGDWALAPIPNPQSPIPNPQSPIPMDDTLNFNIIHFLILFYYNLSIKIIPNIESIEMRNLLIMNIYFHLM